MGRAGGSASRAPAGTQDARHAAHRRSAAASTATPRWRAGLVDLAVNVRRDPMPAWLAARSPPRSPDLARYPDPAPARAAVAARHAPNTVARYC